MQKYTELNLKKLKSQLNKERKEEETKLATSMAEIRVSNPGAYYRNLLQIQDNYIQKLLNALFDTEKTALFNEETKVHEDDYFITLKKEVIDFMVREVDIIRSRILTSFQRDDNQAVDSVNSDFKQKEGKYRDSISNKIEILKEELRLEKSNSLSAKPPVILQNLKWFWLHGTKNKKYIILGIIVLSLLFVLSRLKPIQNISIDLLKMININF
ncbi:MAG: hypothetical protein GXP46_01605 [Deferribacteres bacterium]|nr:hypothetical protein [Deferribacteres bacterium]